MQYVRYKPSEAAIRHNPHCPSSFLAPFVAWETRRKGAKAYYATDARQIGQKMSAHDAEKFKACSLGQRIFDREKGYLYAVE